MADFDLTEINTCESFEQMFRSLLDIIAPSLTDDHAYVDPISGEFRHDLRGTAELPIIGQEPRTTGAHYRAIRFLDNGSVQVVRPERGVPDAIITKMSVDQAMASSITGAIIPSATRYARKHPGNDASTARREEITRLLRLVDDDWADRFADKGYFRSFASS